LSATAQPATSIGYSYDTNGNRRTMTNPQSQATSYTYDTLDRLETLTNHIGQSTRFDYEITARRNTVTYPLTTAQGTLQGVLTYDEAHQVGLDQPISFDQNGQSYFYLADGLGSIVKILDSNGNIVQSYIYDSFGQLVQQTPPPSDPNYVNQPFTYTGREWDAAAGLYYYRLRSLVIHGPRCNPYV